MTGFILILQVAFCLVAHSKLWKPCLKVLPTMASFLFRERIEVHDMHYDLNMFWNYFKHFQLKFSFFHPSLGWYGLLCRVSEPVLFMILRSQKAPHIMWSLKKK